MKEPKKMLEKRKVQGVRYQITACFSLVLASRRDWDPLREHRRNNEMSFPTAQRSRV